MKFSLPDKTFPIRYIDPRYFKNLLTETESEDFYKDFITEEFILRDQLAIDRTILANEVTFLAYIRTGLAVVAAGGTLIHFASILFAYLIGTILLVGGLVVFFVGVSRYKKNEENHPWYTSSSQN